MTVLADELRQEGREEAAAYYQPKLDAKDRRIAELEAKIEMMQGLSVTTSFSQNTHSSRNYEYNASCFPEPNAEIIFEALIELAKRKREGGKFIINTKTDWYMVWKVLHYFKLYTGSEYDFIDVVNDCVLPYLPDAKRRDELRVLNDNFKSNQIQQSNEERPCSKMA